MTDDECGYETAAGTECELPASREDGRCHHHTDTGDEKKAGRPSKLSYERQERIATALEAGVSFKAACEAAGIAEKTGHGWLRRGEDQEEGEYADFRKRITRARGMGKYDLSQSIVEIAKENEDARTLLKYLQHIEGGEMGNEDEDLAGLNLVVPEVAVRDE